MKYTVVVGRPNGDVAGAVRVDAASLVDALVSAASKIKFSDQAQGIHYGPMAEYTALLVFDGWPIMVPQQEIHDAAHKSKSTSSR